MSLEVPKKLFGTDGVRGRANVAPMTVETALALGRAAGVLFRRRGGKHRVVIGKDTRLSCYLFENALISGLCSMGVDTLMVGPLPTPGVAFITRAYRADAGIVISASHNPFQDNGIKFFSADGYKLPDSFEREMEEVVARNSFGDFLPADDDLGKNSKINDADGRYIEFVKATFPRRLSLKNVKIALDCAHGAGFRVAPLVFRELDAEVVVCGNTPNGLNINDNCGSLHPETIQQLVRDSQSDVGIALDGDGDRLVMVDERGDIHNGDTLLAICARDLKQQGLLRNNKVVATVMSNYGLFKAMEEAGIEVVSAQVGDRYVVQEMLRHGANLGGEQSGHVIFSDHNTTGDGLVSALQVLRIMREKGQKLSELASAFKLYPQALVNVAVHSKPSLETLTHVRSAIHAGERALGGSGRVLVRYSGTENICRVMVEGPQSQQVEELAREIAHAVKQAIGA